MGFYSTFILTTNELGFSPFRAIAYYSDKGCTIERLMDTLEGLASTILESHHCVQILAMDDYDPGDLMRHYDLAWVDAQGKHSWVKRR
jgi:hypothetical protein